MEAWDLIPEPKEKWDFYPQSLAYSFAEDYAELGDVPNFKKWIEITYKMYDDVGRNSVYVLMLEGISLYRLGLREEALQVFDRIYAAFGHEGFAGEERKYLKLLLDKKKKSK